MNILERINETVKAFPEQQAAEVLDFAEKLRAKQSEERRAAALAGIKSLRRDFKVEKFNRDECYDR